MKSYEKIKEMLCEELEAIAKKGELTAGSLDTVDKLTHAIKSLETIIAMSEYSEDGTLIVAVTKVETEAVMHADIPVTEVWTAETVMRDTAMSDVTAWADTAAMKQMTKLSADCTKLWKKLRTSRQDRKYASL